MTSAEADANVRLWTKANAEYSDAAARESWRKAEIEAARLLRPGGRLAFLRSSTLVILCSPDAGQADERLHRAQFGMHRFQWPDGDGATEYHLAHGDWIALLRAGGFEIERLVEIQAPEDAETHRYYDYVTAEWGHRWPAEETWVACKRR